MFNQTAFFLLKLSHFNRSNCFDSHFLNFVNLNLNWAYRHLGIVSLENWCSKKLLLTYIQTTFKIQTLKNIWNLEKLYFTTAIKVSEILYVYKKTLMFLLLLIKNVVIQTKCNLSIWDKEETKKYIQLLCRWEHDYKYIVAVDLASNHTNCILLTIKLQWTNISNLIQCCRMIKNVFWICLNEFQVSRSVI